MAEGNYNVLFLSRRNTARSIIAEAVLNRVGKPNFTAFSAGIEPAGELHPLVRDVLQVARFPTDGLRPKHWRDFAKENAPRLDFVITLCDLAAGEEPPRLPGAPVTADWRYPDPENVSGAEWERRREFGAMLAGLERQLRTFIQLPFKSLDRLSLGARLDKIASEPEARAEPAAG